MLYAVICVILWFAECVELLFKFPGRPRCYDRQIKNSVGQEIPTLTSTNLGHALALQPSTDNRQP
jgi:hypothetical protein